MRGRPKILLASNYEEAIDIYEKYSHNLLGVISDIRYPREGKVDPEAGIRLCEKIKTDDKHMPFLLQSSDGKMRKRADELHVGFINKHSKTLSLELRNYILEHFGFGDFLFKVPDQKAPVARATDLQALQQKILEVPDDCLKYHIQRNDFSKWLNARALFPLAEMFRPLRPDDFINVEEVRTFIFDTIAGFRKDKGRGVIAKFDRRSFDEYLIFSRIGEGSIGGKARGLAFIDSLIKRNRIFDKYENVLITIPRTVVLCTDIFAEFMETNNLFRIGLSNLSDDEILRHFVNAQLPFRVHEDLKSFVSVVRNPIAVRSSSLLEDSHYQPFAGVYSTYMIPKIENDIGKMMEMLTNAIKCVYASVFFNESKAYMTATSNVIDEEKMGIVLQEVSGQRYGNRFYPAISGVARSLNFYPIAPEKSNDGIANIAFGLGKSIVEGGISLRFSPKYPKNILQLSSPDMALRDTQKYFYALDMNPESFKISTDDGVNLIRMKIDDALQDGSLRHVASTYDYENNMIRDGASANGKKIVTFSNILNHQVFPLADILQNLLQIGQAEMNNPIEIEFAVNIDRPTGLPKLFHFLQIRPIVENMDEVNFDLNIVEQKDTIISSSAALGNGRIKEISDVIYIRSESFNPAENPEIALKLEKINEKMIQESRFYMLIGPGRWGSSDPWLGIPVKWPQISAARLIVESGLENYRIDPSQGTHFFHNLTAFRVGYFTVNPYMNDGFFDKTFLDQCPAVYEDKQIRHVRFDTPLEIRIDGKRNMGVVLKPVNQPNSTSVKI
ncbi:MAG: PEP/pyruvate-binding domain-containing protein [Bacteroidota bacterium]